MNFYGNDYDRGVVDVVGKLVEFVVFLVFEFCFRFRCIGRLVDYFVVLSIMEIG